MKSLFIVVAFIAITPNLFAQNKVPDPAYRFYQSNSMVQAKNYYLLTLFEEIEGVRKLLENDPELANITKQKLLKLTNSLRECDKISLCYTERMKFTQTEIKDVSNRLATLYAPENALGKLVENHLIASGSYILYQKFPPSQMLVKAWEQDANAINFTIGIYSEGRKPNYPKIDSIAFNVQDSRYSNLVYTCTETVLEECKNSKLFFSPSLTYALRFLEINQREEAADYEPMIATVNKAAYDRVKTIKWDNYKYTLILVPGAGPEDPDVALSPTGLLRCRVAALRYFEGMAPFIVVSGGRVHPYKTRYSEAMEMKKYLVERMHIPESAIILEPHARHTTTNMRNCARLIFRYGMPFDKPCITSTSKSQSYYIHEGDLEKRCEKELLYVPYKKGRRLSNTEAEFYPVLDALQIDADEPLDP